jgi:hypothetical protein
MITGRDQVLPTHHSCQLTPDLSRTADGEAVDARPVHPLETVPDHSTPARRGARKADRDVQASTVGSRRQWDRQQRSRRLVAEDRVRRELGQIRATQLVDGSRLFEGVNGVERVMKIIAQQTCGTNAEAAGFRGGEGAAT